MHIFIISWHGKHQNAITIARQLRGHSPFLSIVYSDPDPDFNFGLEANVEIIKRHDKLFFADKFKACVDHVKSSHALIIHADAYCSDWVGLLERYKHALTEYPAMGAWCPRVDQTPWGLDKIWISSIEGAQLEILAMFDAIVFGLNGDIVERMRRVNYEENIYGWGIDWMIAAYARTSNQLIVMDKSLSVHHEKGTHYDTHEARRGMHKFLDQLSQEEKINLNLLQVYTERNRR